MYEGPGDFTGPFGYLAIELVCLAREPWSTRDWVVGDNPAANADRTAYARRQTHTSVRPTTIRARIAVIDAATAAADDHDANDRSDRLVDSAESTAARSTANLTSRRCAADRRGTRRHGDLRRRIDCRRWRLRGRLSLGDHRL